MNANTGHIIKVDKTGVVTRNDDTELVTDNVSKLIDTIEKHSGERVLALKAIAAQTAPQPTQTQAARTAPEVENSPTHTASGKRRNGTPDAPVDGPEKARQSPVYDDQTRAERRSPEQHKNDTQNEPRKDTDEERHITVPRTREERAKDIEELKKATLGHPRNRLLHHSLPVGSASRSRTATLRSPETLAFDPAEQAPSS